jgi:hypothetical protein
MDPDTIDRVVRRYAGRRPGLLGTLNPRGSFITIALEKWRQLEDVQKAAEYRDPSTPTKLHDRRGYSPEKAVSFFATY